ncbi:GntR family transcriptional regulator [Alcanivoracaceae bacterium MT1]
MTTTSMPTDDATDLDEVVHERIYRSVLEHRLPPGTKLPEEKLAAIFDVSRARIRKILLRLELERIVEMVPHRGAFIAKPTFEESEDIFEARRAIEPAIVRRLARSASSDDVAALRRHVADEYDARDRDDRRAMIGLTGEFHNLLADLAGNRALAAPMHELSARTCLAILLYDASPRSTCRAAEHDELVRRIEAADADGAVQAMLDHLGEIRRHLTITENRSRIDLASALLPDTAP